MDDRQVSVVLAGPAKINGKRVPPDTPVSVSVDLARDLEARGLLAPGAAFDTQGVPLASEFDEAVRLAVTAREADTSAAMQESVAKLIAAHAEELAAAVQRAETAEAKIGELEAALAGSPETMAKLETALSAALARADAAEAKVAELEAAVSAKANTQPAEPKQAGKKS